MHIESQVKNSTVAAVTGEKIKLQLGDHPILTRLAVWKLLRPREL